MDSKKLISLNMRESAVEIIDKAAKLKRMNRSSFIDYYAVKAAQIVIEEEGRL